jgi:pterin-4a-carbinolamine dehydratase
MNFDTPELALIIAIVSQKSELPISQELNWKYFIKLVIRHRIIEQVYLRIKDNQFVPEHIRQQFSSMCQKQRMNLLMISAETIRLSRVFSDAGLTYAVVKGIPLAIEAYGGVTQRQCKDIDLWVDSHNWEQAVSLMQSCGYQQTRPDYPLDTFKRDYYLTRNHDFEFFNSDKKVQVELMFKVSFLGVDFPDLVKLPRKTIIINNKPIITLDNEYHLLLLIIHGAIHAWHRLRWLLDIYLLIQLKKADLHKLLELSERFNCQHMVVQCFYLLKTFFNLENELINHEINNITHKNSKMANLLAQFVKTDYELTGGHGLFNRMFYKYRWYLLQITPPRKRWQVVRHDLFKIDKTFKKLTFPTGWEFAYYLLYPLWVIKYIISRKF